MPSKADKGIVPLWGPPEIIDDVEQGSDAWKELRRGIPTASYFSCIGRDAESKTRKDYLHHLAGEILSGRLGESKSFQALERGKEMEPRARDAYERKNVVEVRQVGFVRRKLPSGRYVGCSPDGLLGKRKGLEIKTLSPNRMISLLEGGGRQPPEHRHQINGTMLIADLDECDLTIFYDGMPGSLQYTLLRDNKELIDLANAIEVFDSDLWKIVVRVRNSLK